MNWVKLVTMKLALGLSLCHPQGTEILYDISAVGPSGSITVDAVAISDLTYDSIGNAGASTQSFAVDAGQGVAGFEITIDSGTGTAVYTDVNVGAGTATLNVTAETALELNIGILL